MINRWHSVSLSLPESSSGIAIEFLYEAGCNGLVEEDNDSKVSLLAYFDATDEDAASLRSRLTDIFSECEPLKGTDVEINTETKDDWTCGWKQWFKPFEIVKGMTVAPSWDCPSDSQSTIITLDPGMAFGTGLHPTTKLCAEAVHKFADKSPASMLDVGCGTGLLAIVAHLDGIAEIVGIEIDEDARIVANENLEKNSIAGIEIFESMDSIDHPFELVVANILMGTLIGLRDSLIAQTAVGGHLLLSGLTHDQEETIIAEFPLKHIETKRLGEWSMIIFSKEVP
jgi:ribosomal protein L11 methyltransferase